MKKQLLVLLGNPINTSKLTQKGDGTVTCYIVPKEHVDQVINLLGVTMNQSNWLRCRVPEKNYKSELCVEIFEDTQGKSTAQLYGIPWNQTDDPYLYLSSEVVIG